MPRLNETTKPLLEEYDRLNIKQLFLSSNGTGQIEEINIKGVRIKFWTIENGHGIIDWNGVRWFVEYVPRTKWAANPIHYVDYCADYFIHSQDGKNRHRYLLIGNGMVGTRSDINPIYYSMRKNNPKPRLLNKIKNRGQITRDLMLNNASNDLTIHYVPLPPKAKQPRNRWKLQYQREMEISTGERIVAVPKPYRMRRKRFGDLLRKLNKPHWQKRGAGKKVMEEMDRIFDPSSIRISRQR
jgi:hypothetical protein